MDLVEQHSQASYTAATPASLNQATQADAIEQAQHLCLGERLPQLPYLDNGREVQERSGKAGAGDSIESRSIIVG
jgi:hypothetical protein